MKKFLKIAALLVFIPLFAACSRVPAGYVGVQFNKYGSDKGVQAKPVDPGSYWLGWNEEMYTFPTFMQTYNFTKNKDEGSEQDESLTFQTVEGLSVNADVGVTYSIEPDKVVTLFQTYRKGIDEITHIYIRNMIRDALVNESSTLGIETVYGLGKADLIKKVQADVNAQVAPLGIKIDKIYWIGNLRLPQNVVNAINAKIQATQMAQQRENEVAQAKAEAQKEVATAQGQAQSKLLVAEAEAKAITLLGEASKNNPGAAQLKWIEKWDGHLPQMVMGQNASTLLNVPVEQK